MDDEFVPPSKCVVAMRRFWRKLESCTRGPRSYLPPVLAEFPKQEELEQPEQPDTRPKWVRATLTFSVVALVVSVCFVVSAVVLLSRTWSTSCTQPLNAFLVVSSVLLVPFCLSVWLAIRWRLSQATRVLLLLSSALLFAWSIVGIVWLAQASSCLSTAPTLFGLTVTFVVIFTLPTFLLAIYCVVQVGGFAVVERSVITGPFVPLLTGKSTMARPGLILGVPVLGDQRTGKTTLLRGLNRVGQQLYPREGVRITDESAAHFCVKAGGRFYCNEEDPTRVPLRTSDLVNADCVVICFSMNDKRTFHSAKILWLPHALQNAQVPIVLVGTNVKDSAGAVAVSRSPKAGSVPAELLAPSENASFNLSSVPTSFILRVFTYLSNADLLRAQRVCRLWKNLGRHSFCWADRSAGGVSQQDVRLFLDEIRASGVLKPTGFPKIGGFFCVDSVGPNNDAATLKMWKKIFKLAQRNSEKVRCRLGANGYLVFSSGNASQ